MNTYVGNSVHSPSSPGVIPLTLPGKEAHASSPSQVPLSSFEYSRNLGLSIILDTSILSQDKELHQGLLSSLI